MCFHLYYLHFCISLYTCSNVICIKLLLTYLLTYSSASVSSDFMALYKCCYYYYYYYYRQRQMHNIYLAEVATTMIKLVVVV